MTRERRARRGADQRRHGDLTCSLAGCAAMGIRFVGCHRDTVPGGADQSRSRAAAARSREADVEDEMSEPDVE